MKIIDAGLKFKESLAKRKATDYIVLHHAEAVTATVEQVHQWHLSNGWSGIGYNFYIQKDGTIYKGRGLDRVGAHVKGYNNRSIGVCCEGAYQVKDTTMPAAQYNALLELVAYLKEEYPHAKIVGHGELMATSCPGQYFPLDNVREEYTGAPAETYEKSTQSGGDKTVNITLPQLKNGSTGASVRALQQLLDAKGLVPGKADGIFGKRTEEALKKYQGAKGLTVDGICGQDTWTALLTK